MKEIKFRLWVPDWDGDSGKMFMHPLPLDPEFKEFGLALDPDAPYSYDTSFTGIAMQYTGLKDKNGVEIYEGDIIDTHVKSGRYMKVYYNEDFAGFLTAGLGDIEWVKTGGLGKDMCSYIEVIGNIYENPELLKEVM